MGCDARTLISPSNVVGLDALDTTHLGTHRSWVQAVAYSPNFADWMYNMWCRIWKAYISLQGTAGDQELLIITCCLSGVHRSIAAAYVSALALTSVPNIEDMVYVASGGLLTVGQPHDHTSCTGRDSRRPCELCRGTPWLETQIRAEVSRVARQTCDAAMRQECSTPLLDLMRDRPTD